MEHDIYAGYRIRKDIYMLCRKCRIFIYIVCRVYRVRRIYRVSISCHAVYAEYVGYAMIRDSIVITAHYLMVCIVIL